jgi:predicted lactoylglutathione lyase
MNYEKMWYHLKAQFMNDNKKSIVESMNVMEILEVQENFKDIKKETIGFKDKGGS